MAKLISRVAVPRSEDARLEQLADSSAFGDLDEGDPRSVARWAKRIEGELGDEMAPDFDGLLEE